jgi:CheY-like chemotaxis protein
MGNILKTANYRVTTASSGTEALKLFDDGSLFDIVVCDLVMPVMSGYEVTRALRTRFTAGELPIVMVTAKHQVSDMIDGYDTCMQRQTDRFISLSLSLSLSLTHSLWLSFCGLLKFN